MYGVGAVSSGASTIIGSMRFPFLSVVDDRGLKPFRPVVPLRLRGARRFKSALCLLDSGDLNNYMDWNLAEDAGIDLSAAVPIHDDSPGEQVLTWAQCEIDNGQGDVLTLRNAPMIFVRPWNIPGFSSRLGTLGMECMFVRLSTRDLWTEITEPSYSNQPDMRFDFVGVYDRNGSMMGRPMVPVRLAGELPWHAILDTGSPDSFIARDLADEAGLDLTNAVPTGPFRLGGNDVTGLQMTAGCQIKHSSGAAIDLTEIPIIFTDPWISRDYGGVLGTNALDSLVVAISAGSNWIGFSYF
jgi:hypothetical protein